MSNSSLPPDFEFDLTDDDYDTILQEFEECMNSELFIDPDIEYPPRIPDLEYKAFDEKFGEKSKKKEEISCTHPKGSVIINTANGIAFRYCKKCKEDLGDIK